MFFNFLGRPSVWREAHSRDLNGGISAVSICSPFSKFFLDVEFIVGFFFTEAFLGALRYL